MTVCECVVNVVCKAIISDSVQPTSSTVRLILRTDQRPASVSIVRRIFVYY